MRALSRVLAAVLAIALIVVGLVGVVEVILAATDRDPWLVPHDEWLADLRETPWRDDAVVLAAIVLLAVGLLLLFTQLLGRRPRVWAVASPQEGQGLHDIDVSSRSVTATARDAALSVDGISAARARIRRDSVHVEAQSSRRSGPDLDGFVRDAVTGALRPLALQPSPSVEVRVERSR